MTDMTLEEVLVRIDALKPHVAKRGGGGSSKRAQNREYTDLLWHAHSNLGLSMTKIAKLIGSTESCVRNRFVRVGYKQGNPSWSR